MTTPANALCVLRAEGGSSEWEVSACRYGQRELLAACDSFEEAAEFALLRCEQLRQGDNGAPDVHFPDDCPCCAAAQQFVSLCI